MLLDLIRHYGEPVMGALLIIGSVAAFFIRKPMTHGQVMTDDLMVLTDRIESAGGRVLNAHHVADSISWVVEFEIPA